MNFQKIAEKAAAEAQSWQDVGEILAEFYKLLERQTEAQEKLAATLEAYVEMRKRSR